MIDQTLNSRFYYPMTLHTREVATTIDAPFVADLGEPFHKASCILSLDKGKADQGLYVEKRGRWRYALPMVAVSQGVIVGYDINVYLEIDSAITVPENARVFRNGQELDVAEIIPGNEIWTILTPAITASGGTVTSVNGKLPDAQGNVQLDENYELSVSLPFSPNEGDTVLYQNLPRGTYIGGSAKCEGLSSTSIVMGVTLDGTPCGTITYTNGVGVVDLTLTDVNKDQVLEVVSNSPVVEEVNKFAFNLVFKRT